MIQTLPRKESKFIITYLISISKIFYKIVPKLKERFISRYKEYLIYLIYV